MFQIHYYKKKTFYKKIKQFKKGFLIRQIKKILILRPGYDNPIIKRVVDKFPLMTFLVGKWSAG